ncbi:MAG: hypothetical protein AABY93_06150 [Bacteroidota bacterium]
MKSIREIQFHKVWSKNDSFIKKQAMEFWKKQNVLINEEVLEQRSRELIMVATDGNQNIIATSTAVKRKLQTLNNNWFYEYRCFIAQSNRVLGFDTHLTLESLQALEEDSTSDPDKPIGVYVVAENENLHKKVTEAVWRPYKMYFIGFTVKGLPIRVYYFKGAMI